MVFFLGSLHQVLSFLLVFLLLITDDILTCRSHHEKLVIVDYRICFIGGLDLCFGRYDTIEHKVGDCPPSLWPGKDYYNPRCLLIYFF